MDEEYGWLEWRPWNLMDVFSEGLELMVLQMLIAENNYCMK